MEVGDEVLYLPHECHAFNRNPVTGDYPYAIGEIKTRFEDGKNVDYVQELTSRQTEDKMDFLKRSNDPEAEKRKLVKIRPHKPWPAIVTAVHDDGTVSLDVVSNQGGVTLHYRVKIDHSRKATHSCHAKRS